MLLRNWVPLLLLTYLLLPRLLTAMWLLSDTSLAVYDWPLRVLQLSLSSSPNLVGSEPRRQHCLDSVRRHSRNFQPRRRVSIRYYSPTNKRNKPLLLLHFLLAFSPRIRL